MIKSVLALTFLFVCSTTAAVTSKSYTTAEDITSSKTLFVTEFKFDGEQPRGSLYAEVGDRSLVVGKSSDGKFFQVSWTEEHKNAAAGTYTIKVYNEEGYSSLRKAKRDGESADSIKPLASIDVSHQGVWKGPWVSSETVACIVAALLMYFAYSKKSTIMA